MARRKMKKRVKDEKRHSLLDRLKGSLVLTAVLFIGLLILCLAGAIYASIGQYNLGQQKVSIHDDLDGILNSMVDQETGLRGYTATNNTTFLEPFTNGRPQYLAFVQHLQDQTNTSDFANTTAALTQVEARANDWYNDYAQVQIKSMQAGDITTARSTSVVGTGKALFDSFRAAQQQLQQATDTDLAKLQSRTNGLTSLAVFFMLIVSTIGTVVHSGVPSPCMCLILIRPGRTYSATW